MQYRIHLLVVLLLSGCASAPDFDIANVDRSMTPQRVIAEPEDSRGKVVLWGGTILDTRNLEEATQIEVLAYPLNAGERPMLENKPLGRFIVLHPGYLEPTTYAQGRNLTVQGSISGTRTGSVGETTYTYPVVRDGKLHLWPQGENRSRSNVRFGIGIGIGL